MSDFLELAILDGATLTGASLPELEQVIERGQQTFIEVGRALLEIRDRRLYRETHATFETYCRGRWGWGVRRAQQIMAATRFATEDANHGSHFENERQVRAELSERKARELARLASERSRAEEDMARERMTAPQLKPKTDTTSDAYMVEVVRRKLTDIRNEYGILAYWRPVWDAIDALNQEKK